MKGLLIIAAISCLIMLSAGALLANSTLLSIAAPICLVLALPISYSVAKKQL